MGIRMKIRSTALLFAGALTFQPLAALSSDTNPLAAMRCYISTGPTLPAASSDSVKEHRSVPIDPRYHAPISSPRLDTLDVLRIGLSLDTYRQGQVWNKLHEQDMEQPESLHIGSILETDPKKYPFDSFEKNTAYAKRKLDALELALRSFPEKWAIPLVTVVRGWNEDMPDRYLSPQYVRKMLDDVVPGGLGPAGLHWHYVSPLPDGIICSDEPETLIERVFQLFESQPDLPLVLIYSVEGINMAGVLGSKYKRPIGTGTGPRQPGQLTDAMVAMVVGRPERLQWLRNFAPYTKVHANRINPEFTGWRWTGPKVPFVPTQFFPKPWTERSFQQFDSVPVLAKLHRPVTVSLQDASGKRLKGDALKRAQASAWTEATRNLNVVPARVFHDTGKPTDAMLAEWSPALDAAQSPVDLLASDQSYNLTKRLGDTGSASPFVGIALATMASFSNADASVVMPLRRSDQATLMVVSSPTMGEKPYRNVFDVKLMPQTASNQWPVPPAPPAAQPQRTPMPTRFIDPEQVAKDKETLDRFIADGPGVDLSGPNKE